MALSGHMNLLVEHMNLCRVRAQGALGPEKNGCVRLDPRMPYPFAFSKKTSLSTSHTPAASNIYIFMCERGGFSSKTSLRETLAKTPVSGLVFQPNGPAGVLPKMTKTNFHCK